MQNSESEPKSEKPQRGQEKAVQTARVSPEKRRRDSLMSNRAMRHAYSSVEKQVRRFFSPQASRFSPMFPIQANQHFLMRNARFQVFVRYDLESE